MMSTILIDEMNWHVDEAGEQMNVLYSNLDKDLRLPTPHYYYDDFNLICFEPSHHPELYDAYWYHPDHLGSSSFITNTTGEISQHMEYLPFGETLVEEHLNSYNSPFKFNGKEFDAETGNYYYGARYLNPKWSTFLTPDPALESYPGISPYAYTLNNPVRYVDPTGMFVESPDEWVYDKQNEKYVWQEEVHSPTDISDKNRFEYVGPQGKDIEQHFDRNLSSWNRIKRAVGGNVNPNVDEGSYVSAKVTPKLQEAIQKQQSSNQKFVNSDDDFTTRYIYPEIDLNIGLSRKTGILSSNTYSFSSSLMIDGESISFKGEFTIRNRDANYINHVDASKKSFATPFGESYTNPVIFSGRGPTVIINLNTNSDQKKIRDFMWNFK